TAFTTALQQVVDPVMLKDVVLGMGVGDKVQFFGFISAVFVLIGVQLLQEFGNFRERFENLPLIFRWSAYYAVIDFIVFFGYFGAQPFIYFQF
ncbi:MAG: hypothetical protein IIC64_13000, partial [SAR324 cluster bacterium]|nr:hypothetical protein [SAR324 cluster bacterium]